MARNGFTTLWLMPILVGIIFLIIGLMARSEALRSSWYQQTVADNMASSAATVLAREMNLLAMTNRALLANELAIAQLLGLASWFQMMKDVADRSAMASSWIPYLNAITRNIANAVDNFEEPFQQILHGVLYFQRIVTTAIRATQWYARISFAMTLPKTMEQILAAHDVGDEPIKWQLLHAPGLVPVPWLWWTFIPAQASGNDNQLAHRLMLESLDPFSKKRSYEWLDALQIEVEKAGGARLQEDSNGSWSWQSMDTVSIHVRGLLDSDEYPWGDGATYLGEEIESVGAKDFGRTRKLNPTATQWGVADQVEFSGNAQPFRYFNRTQLNPADWPAVIVVLPEAVAKASVVYSRPTRWFRRSDGKNEQANLFNALWQSQLQSLSQLERALLTARVGDAHEKV
ncbi:hypothetical protein [Pseudidiomarina sp. CB1]|uniref:hypothetical protein n=1 Tax=Pseudidiomarina sp. CB1 TaxID=2972484 RepID=UPI002161D8D9|nr:hypothetical protein [Pseudidiomarina sp. CB1]